MLTQDKFNELHDILMQHIEDCDEGAGNAVDAIWAQVERAQRAYPQALAALQQAELYAQGFDDCDDEDLVPEYTQQVRDAIAAAGGTPIGEVEPAAQAETPSGEIWLSTVIRKGWEPRMAHHTSKEDLRADIVEYCDEVLDILMADDQDLESIKEAMFEIDGSELHWGQAL